MKINIKLMLGAMFFPAILLAQNPLAEHANQKPREKFSTLYIVLSPSSGKELMVTHNLIINNSKIAKLEQMRADLVQKRFGSSANVVFIVTPTAGVKLTKIGDIYKKHNVSTSKRRLPLKLDGMLYSASDDVVVDETSLKSFDNLADSIVLKTSNREEILEKRKRKLQ
ncbi:hypothetical protein [Mucilaginibacter sp. UYCu711]|uniref:hypothetical protein n=1 Tax=Mucilaginibacter sp. UYCu711 TaxID=3156339 RepID=UPI003D1B6AE0